ncbi:hypothetical protein M427DRAFT_133966 [Gonapodya prolifera JEL478]|uniref:CRAL-TRIO domain-containing protein n=1 Tax=Gonapodya prolifera (strain JEL478) TaxID=1344416 RepID=A0A139AIJ7_GONPJ|nr:hypothetical protein M427DRAFT_133966 [Gonapodya prolifera JEL478]|eukprot:KXS16617.1 hypothetical protein M427DRAFT_133966 [Gonapodya prolifera JEL478]
MPLDTSVEALTRILKRELASSSATEGVPLEKAPPVGKVKFVDLPGPEYNLEDPPNIAELLAATRKCLLEPPYSFVHPFPGDGEPNGISDRELLTFLRWRKYHPEMACFTMSKYYEFRINHLGLKERTIPYDSIKQAVESGFLVIHPKMVDREGRQIIYMRPELLKVRKLDGGAEQFIRAMWALLVENAMKDGSESLQLKGVTLLNNAKGMNLGLIIKLWPQFSKANLKMMGEVFQGHIPVRMVRPSRASSPLVALRFTPLCPPHGPHLPHVQSTYLILNEPVFFDFIWRVSSSVMKKKLQFRIFFLVRFAFPFPIHLPVLADLSTPSLPTRAATTPPPCALSWTLQHPKTALPRRWRTPRTLTVCP